MHNIIFFFFGGKEGNGGTDVFIQIKKFNSNKKNKKNVNISKKNSLPPLKSSRN